MALWYLVLTENRDGCHHFILRYKPILVRIIFHKLITDFFLKRFSRSIECWDMRCLTSSPPLRELQSVSNSEKSMDPFLSMSAFLIRALASSAPMLPPTCSIIHFILRITIIITFSITVTSSSEVMEPSPSASIKAKALTRENEASGNWSFNYRFIILACVMSNNNLFDLCPPQSCHTLC